MTKINIVMKNMSVYLKIWLMLVFEYIYHIDNFMIDHVMNSATHIHIIKN